MMSSDISLFFTDITVYLKVHSQKNLQGFNFVPCFFFSSLFNFQGASLAPFPERLTNISHLLPHCQELFSSFSLFFLHFINYAACATRIYVIHNPNFMLLIYLLHYYIRHFSYPSSPLAQILLVPQNINLFCVNFSNPMIFS